MGSGGPAGNRSHDAGLVEPSVGRGALAGVDKREDDYPNCYPELNTVNLRRAQE